MRVREMQVAEVVEEDPQRSYNLPLGGKEKKETPLHPRASLPDFSFFVLLGGFFFFEKRKGKIEIGWGHSLRYNYLKVKLHRRRESKNP